MKIAIEAQRIFRSNKHGMDFVALESIRELQKIDKENEYYIFVSPGDDRCLEETPNMHIIEVNCPTTTKYGGVSSIGIAYHNNPISRSTSLRVIERSLKTDY